MEKNATIKSLGRVIGNLVVHKVVLKFGTRGESESHTSYEIINYRENGRDIGKEYHWNEHEKALIKSEVTRYFKNKMNKKYSHVKFPRTEAQRIINESIKECLP